MQFWTSPPPPGTPLNQTLGAQTLYLPGGEDDYLWTAGSGGSGALSYIDGLQRRSFTANQSALYRTAYEYERVGAGSIMWVGRLIGAPTTAACLGGLTYTNSNTTPFSALQIKRRSVSSNNFILTHSVGGGVQQIISTTLITSGPAVIVGTAGGNAQALWVYDIAVGSVSVVRGTVAGTISSVSGARMEVGDSFNARNPNAACEMMVMFNRPLADSECLMLLNNPYAVFEPRMYAPTFGPPASAGFLAAWASQRSRVIGAGVH